MPVSLSVEAALTTAAHVARARQLDPFQVCRAFQITDFLIGDQGHDPTDPTVALDPDVSTTSCMGDVFGPKAIGSVSYANQSCPQFHCLVSGLEYTGYFSSICLVATIVASNAVGDPAIGSTFTAAVATRPRDIIADTDDLEMVVSIQD